jgi:D-tyrosyl-tRNA(Tyr) deacylase
MRIVLQRVSGGSVSINGEIVSSIDNGYVLLIGVYKHDSEKNAVRAAKKISSFRAFADNDGKMNINIHEARGSVLSIPQFTLTGDTGKGNRPGFDDAAAPREAKKLWDLFNDELKASGIKVKKGVFGAMMSVTIINNGPVTFILEN